MFLAGNSQIPNNWWKFARHQVGTPITVELQSFQLDFYVDSNYESNHENPTTATFNRISEYLTEVTYPGLGSKLFQHEYVPITQAINAFYAHEMYGEYPNYAHIILLKLKFQKEVAGAFEYDVYARRDQFPPNYKSGTRFYIRNGAPYKCTFKTYPTALLMVGSFKRMDTSNLESSHNYSFSRAIWNGNDATFYYYEKGSGVEKSVTVACSSKPPDGQIHYVVRVVNGELLFQIWSGSTSGEGTLVARPDEHPHFAIGAGGLFYVPVLWGI